MNCWKVKQWICWKASCWSTEPKKKSTAGMCWLENVGKFCWKLTYTVDAMEEIRLASWYMVNIPVFARFSTSHMVQGFLPSTVSSYKVLWADDVPIPQVGYVSSLESICTSPKTKMFKIITLPFQRCCTIRLHLHLLTHSPENHE